MTSNQPHQPLVSIVLGFKNGIEYMDTFIDHIRAQTYKNIELICVDNNSDDGAGEVAKKRSDKYFVQGPERSAQRNRGIKESSGKYCLILDGDQYLSPEVVEQCVATLEADEKKHCMYIPEETLASGFWGACKKFERDFYLIGDISAEAARFYEREKLLSLDPQGFDETQTGSEDWDLSDRYIAKYPGYGRCMATLMHDEGNINLKEQIAKKKYYSTLGITDYLKNAPDYRKKFFLFRPSVLKQWYKLPLHPILTIGTVYMKVRESLTIIN